MELTIDERIHELRRDRWVGYPVAKKALDDMESLFNYPRIDRMPNILLIGRSNNGKTQVLRRFMEQHQASDNFGGEAIHVPVLYVQAPTIPDEKRLYADILNQIFAKFSFSDTSYKLLENVKDKLTKIGLRVLIIDELNSIVTGSMAKQRQFLVVLKHLSNELKIPIIAAGTDDAVRALQTDRQLASRFTTFILPRWSCDADYRRLLASYEKMLPLKHPSNLSSVLLANAIWSRSEGTIGDTIKLLKKSAEYAIKNGIEYIDIDILDKCGHEPTDMQKKRLLEV